MKVDQFWRAVETRDANADGQFVFAVRSTGIYCRPSCPARRPAPDQVAFYPTCDAAEQAGYRACRRCHPRKAMTADVERVHSICRVIESHIEEPPKLSTLAVQAGMSPFHLQRVFKRVVGVSPREYADARRFETFRKRLKRDSSVTEAVYAVGYGSSSRAYARTSSRLGMTPSRYRQGGPQTRIHFAIVRCALGRLLVAATDKGICRIGLADSAATLESELQKEFHSARLCRGGGKLTVWVRTIVRHLDCKQPRLDLPLDIRGTAFQWRVWKALQSIPYGQSRSYSEIARAVGKPKAVRAVARACATNPVALVIPCHRVVRKNGDLGGYYWGIRRKRALLKAESCSLRIS